MTEWDFPRIKAWLAYCDKHPPLQALAQGYVGYSKPEPVRITEENFSDFIKSLQSNPSR